MISGVFLILMKNFLKIISMSAVRGYGEYTVSNGDSVVFLYALAGAFDRVYNKPLYDVYRMYLTLFRRSDQG